MTTNPRSREAAYADLVSGLIDARIDVASDRFDAELEAAEASGRLDPATARLIRWWQRESVRAVTEHARTTIPVSLVALEKAANESREAVYRADAAWTTARGVSARATYAADTDLSRSPSASATRGASTPAPAAPPPAPPVVDEPSTVAENAAPAAAPVAPVVQPTLPPPPAPPAPPVAAPTLEPPGYPVDEPAAPPAFDAPAPVPAGPYGAPPAPPSPPAPPAPPVAAYPPAPDEAPAIVDLTTPRGDTPDPDPSATPATGRRRTLLAGLTVLPRND